MARTSTPPPPPDIDPNLTPLEPPPGTQADVTVKYRTPVNPERMAGTERAPTPREARYSEELRELAAAETAYLEPADPIDAFLEEWRDYRGAVCMIYRLADPPARRGPNSYARPCFEAERIGQMDFNPVTFVDDLQWINGQSGGAFRVWLIDAAGASIPGARLERALIADPLHTRAAQGQSQEQPREREREPKERQKSDTELLLERVMQAQLQRNLEAITNPPPPPPPAPAGSGLSGEDQTALFLFKQTDFLPSIFSKMTELAKIAQNPEATVPTWKDRGIEALQNIVTTNPAIVERVSMLVENIFARLLPDTSRPVSFAPTTAPPARAMPPVTPRQYAPPSLEVNTGLPEAPDPDDDIEGDDMAILDSVIGLLNGNEPLRADNPVFVDLAREYPIKWRMAIQSFKSVELDAIVEYISAQNPLYKSLLESELTGPHLRARLTEFQELCKNPPAKPAAPYTQPAAELPTSDLTEGNDND